MKKYLIKLISLLLATLLLCSAVFFGVFFGIQGLYVNSYQKGFLYQYRALQNSDPNQPKIIVIGGSYMTFAVDSAQLSEETGMPAYTLGIHSGMGMNYLFDTAKKFINPGDIVVLSFNPFTSGEYGMDLIYLSIDGQSDMLLELFADKPLEVLKSAGDLITNKLYSYAQARQKGIDNPDGVYSADAFDTVGNLIFDRSEYCAVDEDLYKDYSLDVNDLNSQAVRDVNDLYDCCLLKGAAMYSIYCPSFVGYYGASEREATYQYQLVYEDMIKAPLLADIWDVRVDKEYIYNGALHLNNEGAKYYTGLITEGLKSYNVRVDSWVMEKE